MADLSSFVNDPGLRSDVADALAGVYQGTDSVWPDVDDVISEVLDTVRADVRDRAEDQATCNKVDACVAKAIVLNRLADWLEAS